MKSILFKKVYLNPSSEVKNLGPMDVLLIEDEAEIAQAVLARLSDEGFRTTWLRTISEVEKIFDKTYELPQVVVFDRLVEQRDLLEFIPKFRNKNGQTGLLVVSAINSPMEKAAAIELGADDYLGKPFAMDELVARIRALYRRTLRSDSRVLLTFGDLVVDTVSRSVAVNNQKLNLTNKEFLVLKLLISVPGRIFSKSHIYESVWDVSAEFESNVIEATINSLRRKMEDAKSVVKIKNTRQVGYWVEA